MAAVQREHSSAAIRPHNDGLLADEEPPHPAFDPEVIGAIPWENGKRRAEHADRADPYVIRGVDDILKRNVPERPDDHIEDIVPAEARHVEIVAHEGHGKTSVALNIFLPAAVGRKACGRFRVARPLRTLFIEDDTPEPVMRRREAAIITAMHLTAREQEMLRSNWLPLRDPGFIFRDPARLQATLEMLEAETRPVDVVAIDSRTTAWADHPDDPVAARDVHLQVIKPLADRFGVIFVILSHPPKARTDPKGNRARLTVGGTGVTQRQADQLIGLWLEADDPPAVSFTWLKVRDGAIPPLALFTADLDREGWGWCALQPSDDTSLFNRSAVDQAKVELATFIAAAPERTRQDCLEHVKKTLSLEQRTTDDALRQLVDERAITRRRRGRETVYATTNLHEGLSLA